MVKENKYIGSSPNDFLEAEGILTPTRQALHEEADAVGELDQIRQTLDSRYDDIKSGKVKLIPGDEVVAEPGKRITARRAVQTPDNRD